MRRVLLATLGLCLPATSLFGYTATLHYVSEPGDYIGQGQTYDFSHATGTFTVERNYDNGVSISYREAGYTQWWDFRFAAPDEGLLVPGLYTDAMRFPFQDPGHPGLDVSGNGRGSNMLTGWFRVDEVAYSPAGEVLVFGQPVIGPGADRGMVFQDYTSFDHRTVLGNVAFGLECQGVPRRERYELARHWIGRVGLSVAKDEDKYPHELSGGMRQRVAIARTLILKPRIILMDEPFGALDPQTRMNMQDLLVGLWKSVHATVFFITHSIEEAVFLGDRVYVLSSSPGKLIQEIEIEPADRPASEMQKQPRFQESVAYIRDLITSLERKPK